MVVKGKRDRTQAFNLPQFKNNLELFYAVWLQIYKIVYILCVIVDNRGE